MRGFSISHLKLRQVGGQVVGEPAVADPEGLGPGRLRVPHDPEPVVVGLEGHDAVVPDPELFFGCPRSRTCLVVRPSRPVSAFHRLLSLDGPAPEGRGAVVEALGYPDAHSVGGTSVLPAGDRLQVVDGVDDPDEGL